MTQRILGFAGRKQAGKNTCCNFILGLEMVGLALTSGFRLEPEGLYIKDIMGQPDSDGIFDYFRNNKEMDTFKATHLNQHIKIYSFADLLKKNVCIEIMGLTHRQCFGTDEEKNSETQYKWQDMPGVITVKKEEGKKIEGRLGKYYEKLESRAVYHEAGQMTAREVLQFVGTEIFRKMYGPVWAEATLNQIKKDDAIIALICDVRFPDEVAEIKKAGGQVVRLTRNQDVPATHTSEVSLDKANYDWNNFDYIIDNATMDIPKQNEALYHVLHELGWPQEVEAT